MTNKQDNPNTMFDDELDKLLVEFQYNVQDNSLNQTYKTALRKELIIDIKPLLHKARLQGQREENNYFIAQVRKKIDELPEWRGLLPIWLKQYEDRLAEIDKELQALEGKDD